MWNSIKNSRWAKGWGTFLSVFFSARFFIPFGFTGIALYLSAAGVGDVWFSNLMAVIGAVFGGITGAVLKDEYNERTGKNILENKARSAIRNIQSIEKQLVNIRLWIINFMKRRINKEQKYTLEEIDRHLSTTQMNIRSGFKDWKDMVPELVEEEERFAELDKKQKEVLQSYMVELLEKRKNLVSLKDEKQIEELKKKISGLEKQIKEIRSDSVRSIGVSIPLSGTPITGNMPFTLGSSELGAPDSIVSFGISPRCANCGKPLKRDISSRIGISNAFDSYCEECKGKLFGL